MLEVETSSPVYRELQEIITDSADRFRGYIAEGASQTSQDTQSAWESAAAASDSLLTKILERHNLSTQHGHNGYENNHKENRNGTLDSKQVTFVVQRYNSILEEWNTNGQSEILDRLANSHGFGSTRQMVNSIQSQIAHFENIKKTD